MSFRLACHPFIAIYLTLRSRRPTAKAEAANTTNRSPSKRYVVCTLVSLLSESTISSRVAGTVKKSSRPVGSVVDAGAIDKTSRIQRVKPPSMAAASESIEEHPAGEPDRGLLK